MTWNFIFAPDSYGNIKGWGKKDEGGEKNKGCQIVHCMPSK